MTSDKINNGDLLRFYQGSNLKSIDPQDFDYHDQLERLLQIEADKGGKSTSLYSQNDEQTTVPLYRTETYTEYQK